MYRALPILLIALSTPLVAQEPGSGVVGEGSQTQSVELLQDSVSVTLESSGSLSLGRGDDGASGGASISVNDTTIVGVSNGSREDGPSGSSAEQVGNAGGVNAGSVPAGRVSSAGALAGQLGTSGGAGINIGEAASSAPTCVEADFGREQLIGTLSSGQEVWMRPTACTSTSADIAQLASDYPQLKQAVVNAGRRFEEVFGLRISDDFVIVDMLRTK